MTTPRTFRGTALASAVLIAGVVVACGGGGGGDDQTPPISCQAWTPSSIAGSLKPGEQKQMAVTYTACEAITSAAIKVAPELAPYIQVSPATIANVPRGATRDFSITVRPPVDATPVEAKGDIQLQRSSGVTESLPATIQVIWAKTDQAAPGVTFSYPTFGQTSALATSSRNQSTIVNVNLPTQNSNGTSTQYIVAIIPNQPYLTLSDWFTASVDPNNRLVTSGTFKPVPISSDLEAFVLDGPLPSDWDRGPVSSVYAFSASRRTAVTVTPSNSQTVTRDLRVSNKSLIDSYLAILKTLVLP